MIGEHRADFDSAEIELHVLQLFEGHASRHLIERDRKKSALHLLKKRTAQTMHRALVTEDANINPWTVGRDEKREALDVVPMGVGDQHVKVHRHLPEFLHDRLSKPAN